MLKVWPIASERLLKLQKKCKPFLNEILSWNVPLENNEVNVEYIYTLSFITAKNIQSHVDYGSCRYSALLTYKADHELFGKHYKNKSRITANTFVRKPPPPWESAHIGPGQIVLFTSTNPHWLEGTTELQAIHFDTDLTEQDELESEFIRMMESALREDRKNKAA